ncbi:MAG: 1-(5-phosphoribosyl)-5-[(5-phosphoribosylamino)methylideneamino]imidazole-4-carboxamide isomerase [bacterium]
MIVIPAIDLRGGQCVRLEQGKLEKETVFSRDPVFMAKLWQAEGAKMIHVVDLDGAFSGVSQNTRMIKKIVRSVNIPVELGGGIRSLKIIRKLLSKDINRVILGTVAVYDPSLVRKAIDEFGRRIVVGIDAYEGKVAIAGWKDITAVDAIDLARKLENWGISEIIFTDISKDGMMQGPNVSSIKKMAKAINIPLIVSGGVSSLKDVRRIKKLEKYGVSGMIIGKALYNGAIKLREAIRITEE